MNKMLVIYDSVAEKDLLEDIFKQDFDITFGFAPDEYIEKVKNNEFDIILVDTIVMIGLDFIKKIKSTETQIFPPIIFIGNANDSVSIANIFEAGASEYFTHPFNRDILYSVSRHACNKYLEEKKQMLFESYLKKALRLFLSDLDENIIMQKVLQDICECYEATRAKIFIKEGQYFVNKYEWAVDKKLLNKNNSHNGISYQSIPESLFVASEKSFTTNNTLYLDDIAELKNVNQKAYEFLLSQGVKSYASAPIKIEDEVVGLLTVTNFNTLINRLPELTLSLCGGLGAYFKNKIYKDELEFDSLTGLYHKQAFKKKMKDLLTQNPKKKFIILKVDIDNFKVINSLYGIEYGDKILKEMASIITSSKQKVFYSCRVQNDEFLILTGNIDLDKFKENYKFMEQVLLENTGIKDIQLCFGAYEIENNLEDPEIIYSKVCFANKEAKKETIFKFKKYIPEDVTKMVKEKEMFDDFETAISNDEFKLYIQPKFDIQKNKYCGGEALVRWLHKGKIVPPNEFISLFEKAGKITKLDLFMLEKLLINMRKWIDEGYTVLPVSVNLSKNDFIDLELYEHIVSLIDRYKIPHDLIELEITETTYVSNANLIEEFCHKMVYEQGIKILMDDFGTGLSSLNTLKDLDISVLKLDCRFVEECRNIEKQKKIIISVKRMASDLGIPVVIEGVETKNEVDFFKKNNIRYIQGYYFGHPEPDSNYIKKINNME